MLRTVMIAAAVGLTFGQAALADDAPMCDEATIMKMQDGVDAMTGEGAKQNKFMAQQHLDIAKTAMQNGNTTDCVLGLTEAGKYMKKKG